MNGGCSFLYSFSMILDLGSSLFFPCRTGRQPAHCSFKSRSQFLIFLPLGFPQSPYCQTWKSSIVIRPFPSQTLSGILMGILLTLASFIPPRGFGRFSIRFSSGILFHHGPRNSGLAPEVTCARTNCSQHLLVSVVTQGRLQYWVVLPYSPNHQVFFIAQPEDHLFQHHLRYLLKRKIPWSHPVQRSHVLEGGNMKSLFFNRLLNDTHAP